FVAAFRTPPIFNALWAIFPCLADIDGTRPCARRCAPTRKTATSPVRKNGKEKGRRESRAAEFWEVLLNQRTEGVRYHRDRKQSMRARENEIAEKNSARRARVVDQTLKCLGVPSACTPSLSRNV